MVHGLPPIDIFFHDSEHTYGWQQFEYNAVRRHLSSGGLIASDDVDASFAFLDFCAGQGVEPHLFLDTRKAVGVAGAL